MRVQGPWRHVLAVNRVWFHYFGQGLVETPSNFGREGTEPSHPEMLEWLACELVDHGWNIRHIHRLILCSATYRQKPQLEDEVARDLFHRWWPQRMTAEMFRDSLLQLSGAFNSRMYRSEEHTSELQSLTKLVCRLLLEQKNTCTYIQNNTQPTS